MNKITDIIARGMLGHIFLIAGLQKIGGYEGTQGYMESVGLPGMMLPLVILLEAGAGLAIIMYWSSPHRCCQNRLYSADPQKPPDSCFR